jgi:hypothetical protein
VWRNAEGDVVVQSRGEMREKWSAGLRDAVKRRWWTREGRKKITRKKRNREKGDKKR